MNKAIAAAGASTRLMSGLDTNVLILDIMQDDAKQSTKATATRTAPCVDERPSARAQPTRGAKRPTLCSEFLKALR